MNLLVDLFLFLANHWVLFGIFGLMGIACFVNESRAAGVFLICIAVMILIGEIG